MKTGCDCISPKTLVNGKQFGFARKVAIVSSRATFRAKRIRSDAEHTHPLRPAQSAGACVRHSTLSWRTRRGETDDMKASFHKDATIFGYVGADLFAGPIEQLFAWNDENGPATGIQTLIASIDLIDTVATVRLELDNWTGHRFTDLFRLLTRISHHLTVEARNRPAITALRLLAVLNGLFKYASARRAARALY